MNEVVRDIVRGLVRKKYKGEKLVISKATYQVVKDASTEEEFEIFLEALEGNGVKVADNEESS